MAAGFQERPRRWKNTPLSASQIEIQLAAMSI